MSIWYRASWSAEQNATFSGDGGLFVAGRWNHLGRRAIYCSETIALCTLEWLAHQGLPVSGFTYYRYAIDVPDHLIQHFLQDALPKNWDMTPATNISRNFAEENLFVLNNYLGLVVPSVIVPEEKNLIINPLHPEFQAVKKNIKILGKYMAPVRH